MILADCYIKSFMVAQELGCESIALPCISCGVFGFDPKIATQIAVGMAVTFLQSTGVKLSITFVIMKRDKHLLKLYTDMLSQIQRPATVKLPRTQLVELEPAEKPLTGHRAELHLQSEYEKQDQLDDSPVLANFGVLHPVENQQTLQEVIVWSEQLEAAIKEVGSHSDAICTLEESNELWTNDPYELDMAEVKRAQLQDKEWDVKILYLQTGDLTPGLAKDAIHKILCTINDYILAEEDILFRLWNKSQQRGKTHVVQQLCVPKQYQAALIANAHQNGHFGAMKVFLQLREAYYWNSMFKDVKELLEACKVCQYANSKATRRVPLNPAPVPTCPLSDVHMDLLKMSTTSHGYTYVAVIICAYSRLTRCVALRTKTAQNTADAFYKGWLSVYGAPVELTLTTDNGLEFVGKTFQCLIKSYGLKSKFTNYYSPSSNGMCERQNRNILAVLRRICNTHPKDWSLHLDSCTNALNSTVTTSTGVSPFELVHGVKIRLPHQIKPPQVSEDLPVNEKEAIAFWKERLETMRDTACLTMTESQVNQKHQYDRKTSETNFKIGDICARVVERLPIDGSKLVNKYEGAYEIRRFTTPTNVELYDIDTAKLHPRFLHVNKL